ncbi:MAG: (d)CMP kinase [Candidatus Eremiobacteraeota bacterium]|nr:(d)CMP kinase [Candidatus Eremiobacteraeota bacterium]
MSVPAYLQIAIDGPAASGKTTVAHALARRLAILYLDTGAMYRTLAFLAIHSRTDADNEGALSRLWRTSNVAITLDEAAPLGFRIVAGGVELKERELQSNEVSAIVSTVAAHAEIRETMVESQRAIAARGAVVMCGRDIGTVVLPFAQVKIFLTASVAARVERRRLQLLAAGVDVSAHRLAEEIEERDRLDRSRTVSPLEAAADCHVLDSSEIDAEAVVGEIASIVKRYL